MKKDKLEEFQKILSDWRDDILQGAEKTVSGLTERKENYPDPTDRATVEWDRNFTLRIRDRERKLLKKIESALIRIESGTYGICDDCGEDIGEARLKARPVTTQCIECKTEAEAKEKARGI